MKTYTDFDAAGNVVNDRSVRRMTAIAVAALGTVAFLTISARSKMSRTTDTPNEN